jgi:hypothetical protein
MSKAKEVKLYRTFVRGLITEAGYLTYPEDSSSDELNTIPTRKGNRTRRFGIDFEDNFQQINVVTSENDAIKEFVWKAVGNVATDNFLCIQVGTKIKFFSLEENPVSDSLRPFEINLLTYIASGASTSQVQMNNVEFSSGKSFLFIVHPYVEPLVIEFNKATNTITVVKVVVQIRDFEGLNDGLANDQEPTTLSKEHHYNLLNQGWGLPGTAVPGGVTVDNDPVYQNPYTGNRNTYKKFGDENLDI